MNEIQKSTSEKIKKISEREVKEFVLQRFEDVKKSNKIKDLISFQAMNKYMVMAHNQNELKVLGNIVASNKKNPFSEILAEYEKHLKAALNSEPTIKKHSNVIMHIFGFFSKNFSQLEKEQFFNLLNQFQEEQITIGSILSEINPIIYRFNNTYLASQTYFLLYSDPDTGNIFQFLRKGNSE
ncbi:MAG: YbgA family protein [Nitrosopumilus sp.]|nr:YbgA family protein [Nitrosopumilus sp.]MDH3515471.1 YbgA family protein [Nitrosopumilus sp.]MDH3565537.1 YbgA family protein [Nitrosopumilus sp.]MDH5416765.1 YbgA family protein [Nitrosopumilus sp.]MDH5555229.1 YbgA family protein [Nitrosopumilus sp.]